MSLRCTAVVPVVAVAGVEVGRDVDSGPAAEDVGCGSAGQQVATEIAAQDVVAVAAARSRASRTPVAVVASSAAWDFRPFAALPARRSVDLTDRRVSAMERTHRLDRWLYKGRRPNRLARLINTVSARLAAAGIGPSQLFVLEVRGRRTGETVSLPVVVADYHGGRYLVSMLGDNTNWVRNVRAAHRYAVLRHGGREFIRLAEVDPGQRAGVLRRYLEIAEIQPRLCSATVTRNTGYRAAVRAKSSIDASRSSGMWPRAPASLAHRREALVSNTSTVRNAPLVVTALLALLGVALIIIAIVYFTKTSDHLPSFFPGYDTKHAYHHTKHGIAALLVGVLALIGAWITAGRKKTA
jgi:hypothetical protein